MLRAPITEIRLRNAAFQPSETDTVDQNSVVVASNQKTDQDGQLWLEVTVVSGPGLDESGWLKEQWIPRLDSAVSPEVELEQFADATTIAARTLGVNRELLIAFALVRTNITNIRESRPGGETIIGPFAFSEPEWLALSRAHPSEIPLIEFASWSRHVSGAAILLAEHMRELERALDRPATSTELFLAHLVGSGAAAAVILGDQQRPIGEPLRAFHRAAGDEAQAEAFLARNAGAFLDGQGERSVEAVLSALAEQLTEALPRVAAIVALLPAEDRGGAVGPDGEPPWMAVARGELGVKELANGSNPDIEKYHAAAGERASDDVPWCSSFVNWCIRESNLHGIAPTQSKMARSWLNWGEAIKELVPGCVVVLRRGDPPHGHVAFFERWQDGQMMLLGGNQGDAVSIAPFSEGNVLDGGRRMPPGIAALGATDRRALDIDVLARTLWGEARGEPVAGREAIAAVVLNRLEKGPARRFGDSIAGVCRHRKQFSCWNEDDRNLAQLRAVGPDDEKFRECLEIATRAVDHGLADPTSRADHYHHKDLRPRPDWSEGRDACCTIGNHMFFNNIQ